MSSEPSLRELLSEESLGAEASAFCQWLEGLDWDFRSAAKERGVEARALYREWLSLLGWNQSLAARLYRKPGSKQRGVTRQAIDAQMRSLGVSRPLDLAKQLQGQDLDGALDALRDVHTDIESRTSTERLACEQLLALADTYRRLGAVMEARQALVEVIKLAKRSGSPELAGHAVRAVPYLVFQATPYGYEDRELIEALQAWSVSLREAGDLEGLALCLARLAFELYGIDRDGSRESGVQLAKEAAEIARGPVTPRARAMVAACRIVTLSGPEDLQERLEVLEPMVEESRQLADDDRYFALDMLLTDSIEAGRLDALAAIREEMRRLEDRCSAPWPQRYRVTLAIFEGRFEEAERLAVLPATMPVASAAQIRGLQQYEALKLRGEWESLAGLVRWNAAQQPEFIGYRFCLAQLSCLMGQTASVAGWRQEAYLDPEAVWPARGSGTALLSPFDPLVWERSRTERLFKFRYRIEIYVPAEKRQFGYYVLPFLYRGRLVARVDLKADRQAGVLRVMAAHGEGRKCTGAAIEALAAELETLSEWLGLSGVTVGERGDLCGQVSGCLAA